jgi:hypothetical protein
MLSKPSGQPLLVPSCDRQIAALSYLPLAASPPLFGAGHHELHPWVLLGTASFQASPVPVFTSFTPTWLNPALCKKTLMFMLCLASPLFHLTLANTSVTRLLRCVCKNKSHRVTDLPLPTCHARAREALQYGTVMRHRSTVCGRHGLPLHFTTASQLSCRQRDWELEVSGCSRQRHTTH